MIVGLGELEAVLWFLKEKAGWDSLPSNSAMRACREEAIRLNEGSGDFAIEVAAMFFALSVDESRLGDASRQLPSMFVWYIMEGSAFDLSEEDLERLPDIQDDIASGMSWDECRAWFKERIIRVR